MKRLFTYITIICFCTIAVANAGPDKAAIKAKETAAWQTFKDKKADEFKKLIDKDFRGVYADGIYNLQKQLDDMKKWDLKSFTISDFDSFSDEPDVIVTTYTVKIEGTNDGKDASGTFNCGSVWKQEKGTWMAIVHSSVKQEAGTSPAASP